MAVRPSSVLLIYFSGLFVVGTYHDVTMHTDVAMTLIYYVLLRPIMIFQFS